jgi:hypothetical protein
MNRPNSDFDIILFIECENPLNKMIEIYYRTQTHVPNSFKPNEVNDNNVHYLTCCITVINPLRRFRSKGEDRGDG